MNTDKTTFQMTKPGAGESCVDPVILSQKIASAQSVSIRVHPWFNPPKKKWRNEMKKMMLILPVLFLAACASRVPEGYDAQLHPHRPDYIGVQAASAGSWVQGDDGAVVYQPSAPAAAPAAAKAQTAEPADRSAVQVEVTQDGARAGIDILGIRNYRAGDWARNAWGPLKLVAYPVDYVGYMAANHPVQTLVAGLVAWEVADDGVSGLFSSSSSSSTTSAPASDTRQDAGVTITGSNNSVVITTTTGTTAEAPRTTTTTTR
jgi:hypothetical protein